jgi:hypothetical protein
MVWTERVKAIADVASAAWKWVALAAAGLALLCLIRACNRADRAEDEVERLQEAADLERAGFLVAERAKQAELEAAVAKVPALQAEIDRLTKELGKKPKIVTVERIVTAPAPAEGTPRPAPAPGAPCPECMFAGGDTGEIRVDSAHVETREGNEVIALSAECWRVARDDVPATRILAGTASAPVSRVLVETPPSKPGWGGGALGGVGTQGWIATVQVISPPLLGDHLSATVQASGGAGWSGPHGALQGGLLWR